MIRRLIILLLIVGCDLLQEEDVQGCTDSNAINYSPNATVSDNTCEYSVYGGYPDFESICGVDEFGNSTENTGDGICGLCLGQIEYGGSGFFMPIKNELQAVYPNPFNTVVDINYAVSSDSYVNIYIMNTDYNVIDTLIQQKMIGVYNIPWDASLFYGGYYRIIVDFGDVECFYNVLKNPLGCTDQVATNYEEYATEDDGSCIFGTDHIDYATEHWSFERWIHDYYKWYEFKEGNYDWNSIREIFINQNDSMSGCAQEPPLGHCYIDIWDYSLKVEFTYNGEIISSSSDEFREVFMTLCGNSSIYHRECSVEVIELVDTNGDSIEVIKDHDFYIDIGQYDIFTAGWDDTDSIYVITNNDGSTKAMTPHKLYYRGLINLP